LGLDYSSPGFINGQLINFIVIISFVPMLAEQSQLIAQPFSRAVRMPQKATLNSLMIVAIEGSAIDIRDVVSN
jgi:hypothetical protein